MFLSNYVKLCIYFLNCVGSQMGPQGFVTNMYLAEVKDKASIYKASTADNLNEVLTLILYRVDRMSAAETPEAKGSCHSQAATCRRPLFHLTSLCRWGSPPGRGGQTLAINHCINLAQREDPQVSCHLELN